MGVGVGVGGGGVGCMKILMNKMPYMEPLLLLFTYVLSPFMYGLSYIQWTLIISTSLISK